MMKAVQRVALVSIFRTITFFACFLTAGLASAATVNAIWNSAADVPITANGYVATGSTVSFTLNFAPATGTDLLVVNNTNLALIVGTFDNLAQGQPVALNYGGVTYRFMANYYGASGNDLVLVWASSRAFAWGDNSYGQLGDQTTTDRRWPVPVTATSVLAGKTPVALAAGGVHCLALCSDGTMTAWGDGWLGQLGDNTTTMRLMPVAVDTSPDSALYGKLVVALAGGGYHSLALCADGTVAAWGDNSFGQLGDNQASGERSLVPIAVNTALGISVLHSRTVVAISAGGYHNLALCTDGTVAAWGDNSSGQLGDNTMTDRPAPVVVNTNAGVSALYGKTVIAIAAGYEHSLALCSDGTVAAWGENYRGQLGDNKVSGTYRSLVPVLVNTNAGVSALYDKTVAAIAAGGNHSLALCSDGTVVAWGWNYSGELGDKTTTTRLVPVAVNTASGFSALYGKSVVAVGAGYNHSLALCLDGAAAVWGNNLHGQLGDNTTTNRLAPVTVNATVLADGQRCSRLASGSYAEHTLALVAGPPASEITLTGAQALANRSFQLTFTNTPGAFFGVVTATNPTLALSDWASLTGLTEVTPGQFQFTDPQATNSPRRFYRVRSP